MWYDEYDNSYTLGEYETMSDPCGPSYGDYEIGWDGPSYGEYETGCDYDYDDM